MAGTFSGYTSSTYTLTTNPTTVASTGTIDVNSTIAGVAGILGTAGTAWTVTNLGTVESVGSLGIGIDLLSGGSVTNGASDATNALIEGGGSGGDILGNAGTVVNFGTIESAANTLKTVYLGAGGSVTNGAIGSTTALISSQGRGIDIHSAGMIANYGTISQTAIAGYNAIVLEPGTVSSSTDTIANFGLIENASTAHSAIYDAAGGVIANAAGATIDQSAGASTASAITFNDTAGTTVSFGTVINSGTIESAGVAGGAGIYFGQGGIVTNQTSGLITAIRNAINIANTAATIANYGTIESTGTVSAIYSKGGGIVTNATGATIESVNSTAITFRDTAGTTVSFGSVVNSGTIQSTGTTSGSGVYFGQGGILTNQTSGLIIAIRNAINVGFTAATITNYGTIESSGTNTTIYSKGGGLITNAAGATIDNANTTAITFRDTAGTTISFGTVINSGTIESAGTTGGTGVYFGQGGVLTNAAGAMIESRHTAISFNDTLGTTVSFGTVINAGTIESTGTPAGSGVYFGQGGVITNQTAGLISSPVTGISFRNTAGTIDNFGTVISTASLAATAGAGVYLGNGGVITNATGASIEAVRAAISLDKNGTATGNATIFNSGILTGSDGIVIGTTGATGNNTIVNFGTIVGTSGTAIRLGAIGDEVVIEAGSTLQGVVTNFNPGDSFDLPFLTFSSGGAATVVSNGTVSQQLQVVENAGSFTIALDPNQNFSSDIFQLGTDSGTGTLITEAVCFCRGTLILTDKGEVAVEDLRIGDRARTLSGAFKPVTWIGFGRDLVTRANRMARPVIVRAGALADGVPRRDLYLTHGHSLYLDGVLIPVEHLVNHRSILWDDAARVVEYYHIELEDHDVVFAEGAATESYYDAGNRALFQNRRSGSEAGAAKPAFAPVLTNGETVERAWAALFERAGGRTDTDTTDDPDLHLVVDGARFDPASLADGVYTFALAVPSAGTLRLSSRSAVPSLLGLNRHEHRRLGVAIRQIILYGSGVMTCLDHDAPLFAEGGCHLPEGGHSWTDGEFALPASLFAHLRGAFRIVVHTRKHAMRYPLAAPVAAAEPQLARPDLRIVSGPG